MIEIRFYDVSEAMLVINKEKDLGFYVTKLFFRDHEFREFAKKLADSLRQIQEGTP